MGEAGKAKGAVMVCGEAVVDLVHQLGGPAGEGDRYLAFAGGSPANTAVALARLGVPTYFAGRFSRDSMGEKLFSHLERNGVDMRHSLRRPEPSTLAVVDLSEAGDAQYSFYVQGTADFQWSPDELPIPLPPWISALHAGSLALALPPGASAIEQLLEDAKPRAVISIDPNVRPGLLADRASFAAAMLRWAALADLFKVSLADLSAVFPGREPLAVARELAQHCRLLVVTMGEKGAIAFHGGEEIALGAAPSRVVDTVGAGDTFSAALLDGLWRAGALSPALAGLRRDQVEAAMRLAVTAAAWTCSRPGADPPRREDLGG